MLYHLHVCPACMRASSHSMWKRSQLSRTLEIQVRSCMHESIQVLEGVNDAWNSHDCSHTLSEHADSLTGVGME